MVCAFAGFPGGMWHNVTCTPSAPSARLDDRVTSVASARPAPHTSGVAANTISETSNETLPTNFMPSSFVKWSHVGSMRGALGIRSHDRLHEGWQSRYARWRVIIADAFRCSCIAAADTVAGVGDMNGDGFDDVMSTGPLYAPFSPSASARVAGGCRMSITNFGTGKEPLVRRQVRRAPSHHVFSRQMP